MAEVPPPATYLATDFNANSLKVAQLRGILLEYGVRHPSTAKKADLVALFDSDVRPQAGAILSRAGSVQASSHDIEQMGPDGRPITPPPPRPPTRKPRQSIAKKPRVSSAAVAEKPTKKELAALEALEEPEDAAEEEREEVKETTPPPKRATVGRRSLASSSKKAAAPPALPKSMSMPAGLDTPSKAVIKEEEEEEATNPSKGQGKSAIKKKASFGALQEEAEPEEERGSPSKGKNRASVGSVKEDSSRRNKIEEESGFSDYNPFQSGGEGGSPGMASKVAQRRKSRASLAPGSTSAPASSKYASRKSLLRNESKEGPALVEEWAHTAGPESSPIAAAQEDDEEATRATPVKSSRRSKAAIPASPSAASPHSGSKRSAPSSSKAPPTPKAPSSLRKIHPDESKLRTPPDDWKKARQQELAEEAEDPLDLDVNYDAPSPASKSAPILKSMFLVLSAMAALYLALLLRDFQRQSAELGFCDTDSPTNALTSQRQIQKDRDETCLAAMKRAIQAGEQVPHCDTSPWYQPTACAPCPAFAECEGGKLVECTEDRVLVEHPLAFASALVDGMPTFGPVAFPPACERNYTEDNLVMNYAKGMESYLAREKGRIICGEGMLVQKRNEADALKYGVGEKKLFQAFWDSSRLGEAALQRILQAAVADLVEHDDVVKQFGSGAELYYMATHPVMPLTCRARMALVSQVYKNLRPILSTLSLLGLLAYTSSLLKRRKTESAQVKDLVKLALEWLGEQEQLRPAQLRDLCLKEYHDPSVRHSVWSKVEKVVTSNANVKVGEEEVDGEAWEVWTWVGVPVTDKRHSQRAAVQEMYPAF